MGSCKLVLGLEKSRGEEGPKAWRDGGEVGRVAAKEAAAGKDEHDVKALRRIHDCFRMTDSSAIVRLRP